MKTIEWSSLSLEFEEQESFDNGFVISGSERDTVDNTWDQAWGAQTKVRNHYEELTVGLKEDSSPNRFLTLVFRAYNDGIAFRYIIPNQDSIDDFIIANENTKFRFKDDHTSWHTDIRGIRITGPIPLSEVESGLSPVVLDVSDSQTDHHVSVHEAALRESAAMELKGTDDHPYTLQSHLASTVDASPPYSTPWRVVQTVSGPAGLINSNIFVNLNGPNKFKDSSWIQPGKVMWDWRARGFVTSDGFEYGLNNESIKRLIDFASEHNIRYTLLDAGWYGGGLAAEGDPLTPIDEVDVPALADYAASQDVSLRLYIDNTILHEYDLDEVFSTYQDWGIAGIKHGFLGENSQNKIENNIQFLKKAAEYELSYNVHEAYHPTGIRRTYPSFLTREFGRNLGDARPSRYISPDTGQKDTYASPAYHTTLPFVQMLGGPLDMSPGLFDVSNAMDRETIQGSIASTVTAQVARTLVIFTGILTLPDAPEAYEEKSDLFEFIEDMPPMTWDESRVINAQIGDYITVARRTGDEWFLGSETDESERNLDIPLSFLAPPKNTPPRNYVAEIYADAEDADFETNPEAYRTLRKVVDFEDSLTASMASGGGHAVHLTPASAPLSFDTEQWKGYFIAGEKNEITAILANEMASSINQIEVTLNAPSGWSVEQVSEIKGGLPSGKSEEITWVIEPPQDADLDKYELQAIAEYHPSRQDDSGRSEAALEVDTGQPTFSIDAGRELISPGETREVTVIFTNTLRFSVSNVTLELSAPVNWTVEAVSSTTTDKLSSGATMAARWTVSVPDDVDSGSYTLVSTGEYVETNDNEQKEIQSEHELIVEDVEILDNFESGDISRYSGDTNAFSVVSSLAYEGDNSLKFDANGRGVITSLDTSTSSGNSYDFRIYSPGNDDGIGGILLGVQGETGGDSLSAYKLGLSDRNENMYIYRVENGSQTRLAESGISVPTDEWVRGVVNWGIDGTLTLSFYDSNSNEIETISATDTTFESGGYGWLGYDKPTYFDLGRSSSKSKILDNFESGDISRYSGDTNAFSVVSSLAYEGDNSLKFDANGRGVITSLDTSTSSGNSYDFRIYSPGNDDGIGGILLGVQGETGGDSLSAYKLGLSDRNENMYIYRVENGSQTRLAESGISVPTDEWVRGVVNWGIDGTLTLSFYDSNSNEIETISATDTTFESGGYGWLGYDKPTYFDLGRSIRL
jgi:alpha-glucosidase